MSKARRIAKKEKASKTPNKAPSKPAKSPPAQAIPDKSVERLEEVFGKPHESVDQYIQAVEQNLQKQEYADENDVRNTELRWQRHYSSAHKFLAADEVESAVRELQAALKFAERLNDFRLANTYGELGFVSMRLKEFDTARSFFRRALGVRESLFGSAHPTVAIEYSNLGMSYEWENDFEQAKPLLQLAIELLDKDGQYETVNQAEPYEALASICKKQKEFERAQELCQKALEIRDKHAGRLHPISIKTVELLCDIHKAADQTEEFDKARAEYDQRLHEYAESRSFGAAAKMLKHLLENSDGSKWSEKADTCISDFLRMVARR
jgi:tetratricopeptide (TPR) repeat protein